MGNWFFFSYLYCSLSITKIPPGTRKNPVKHMLVVSSFNKLSWNSKHSKNKKKKCRERFSLISFSVTFFIISKKNTHQKTQFSKNLYYHRFSVVYIYKCNDATIVSSCFLYLYKFQRHLKTNRKSLWSDKEKVFCCLLSLQLSLCYLLNGDKGGTRGKKLRNSLLKEFVYCHDNNFGGHAARRA